MRLEINCAAAGARHYFTEAAARLALADAADDPQEKQMHMRAAENLTAAGRGALLAAGMSVENAAKVEPERRVPLTAAEKARAKKDAEAWPAACLASLRAHRAALLAACDWVELPANRDRLKAAGALQAWLDYRQALRDYPAAVADPCNPPPLPRSPA